MPILIACLSTGKGTWGHVNRIIQDGKFEKTILLTNDYGKENFTANETTELIPLNLSQGIKELRDEIIKILKEKIKDTEVTVNIISGTGKEHTALISAILKSGLGMRFVVLTKDGVEEI
jgi:hypothetical protein